MNIKKAQSEGVGGTRCSRGVATIKRKDRLRKPQRSSLSPPRPWRASARNVRKLTGLRCCCDPETSVGLLAAVAEPASARLRVAGQIRAGASGIMAAVIADLNGGKGTSDTEVWLACKLCRRRLDDRAIYLYM